MALYYYTLLVQRGREEAAGVCRVAIVVEPLVWHKSRYYCAKKFESKGRHHPHHRHNVLLLRVYEPGKIKIKF